jgi:glyoxylase-like metal-dependent hydrolase (beta-lactamase superfamily II)
MYIIKRLREIEMMKLIQIVENIFLFKDYVNVYVVKDGDRAILIDFGSGKILNFLSEIGVNEVDYIFHTHYHRDQCFGDRLVLQKKIKIAAPWGERKLFTKAKDFWKKKSYYDIYSLKPTYFVSPFNIPLEQTFKDGDEFEWGSYKFKIIDTRGHTARSVSYLLEHETGIIAFTGDLIHSGGKVINYYDLEYSYTDDGGSIGLNFSLQSFEKLLKYNPVVLLPSHGDIINKPVKDIEILKEKFNRVSKAFRHDKIVPTSMDHENAMDLVNQIEENEDKSLFPHLIRKGFGTTFILLGNNKNCILLDFPGDGYFFAYSYEQLAEILKKKEVETIDFVIPTHYHDDHIGGIPLLQQEHKIPVYALENMVDVLENPTHYRIGCLIDTPIKVDRVLKDGEKFTWDEYEFQIFHFPGQTEYHMGLFTTIDDKRVFFTGDSIPPFILNAPETNNNCINFCQLGNDVGSVKCADILLDCNPDYIAISHYGFFKVNKQILQSYRDHVSQYESIIADLVAQENPNMGFDPNWISFKPVRIISKPGGTCKTSIVVRNFLENESTVEIELNLPEDWTSEFKNEIATVKPKSVKEIPMTIKIPETENPKGRTIITANIKWNGADIGPFPDLMVDHGFIPSDIWTAWTPHKGTDLLQWIINYYVRDLQFFT